MNEELKESPWTIAFHVTYEECKHIDKDTLWKMIIDKEEDIQIERAVLQAMNKSYRDKTR